MDSPFGSDSFEDDTQAIIGAPGLTTEEQIRHLNEAEDWRMRNYVQAQAQARALQALRAAQLAAVEQAQASRHRKRRAGTKKRRSHVSTATSGSTTTSVCTSASASVASSASSKP
ncbi:hypothetical protein FQN49_008882, partial [Arthroderma sp. PD_2]